MTSLNIPMTSAPGVLDEELRLVREDTGRIVLRVTLRAVLFFENGRTREMRLRVASVLDLYRAAVVEVFSFGWNPKTLKFRKMKDKSWLDDGCQDTKESLV